MQSVGACLRMHDVASCPMQVPDLSATQARALFLAGWRDPAALILVEPADVGKALVTTLPNNMRCKRAANGQLKGGMVSQVAL